MGLSISLNHSGAIDEYTMPQYFIHKSLLYLEQRITATQLSILYSFTVFYNLFNLFNLFLKFLVVGQEHELTSNVYLTCDSVQAVQIVIVRKLHRWFPTPTQTVGSRKFIFHKPLRQ